MSAERLWQEGPLFRDGEYAKLTCDSILLADFAAAAAEQQKGGKVRKGVDLGCGSGILCLLLLNRIPNLQMIGLEIREDAVELAYENLKSNELDGRGSVRNGDLRKTAADFAAGSFDYVISNPPYYVQGKNARGIASPFMERNIARGEYSCSLQELCEAACRLCRSGGKFFLCYKPERMAELYETLRRNRFEPKRIRNVHHSCSSHASLILLEARKDGRPGLIVEAPLLLHENNGEETPEYRKIFHRT